MEVGYGLSGGRAVIYSDIEAVRAERPCCLSVGLVEQAQKRCALFGSRLEE
jgi:hypothetical protein